MSDRKIKALPKRRAGSATPSAPGTPSQTTFAFNTSQPAANGAPGMFQFGSAVNQQQPAISFGTTTGGSLFGSAGGGAPSFGGASSFTFGGNSPQAVGTPAAASPFGSSGGNSPAFTFGSATGNAPTPSLGGAPLFGSAAASTPGGFGNSTTGTTSVFGSTTNTPAFGAAVPSTSNNDNTLGSAGSTPGRSLKRRNEEEHVSKEEFERQDAADTASPGFSSAFSTFKPSTAPVKPSPLAAVVTSADSPKTDSSSEKAMPLLFGSAAGSDNKSVFGQSSSAFGGPSSVFGVSKKTSGDSNKSPETVAPVSLFGSKPVSKEASESPKEESVTPTVFGASPAESTSVAPVGFSFGPKTTTPAAPAKEGEATSKPSLFSAPTTSSSLFGTASADKTNINSLFSTANKGTNSSVLSSTAPPTENNTSQLTAAEPLTPLFTNVKDILGDRLTSEHENLLSRYDFSSVVKSTLELNRDGKAAVPAEKHALTSTKATPGMSFVVTVDVPSIEARKAVEANRAKETALILLNVAFKQAIEDTINANMLHDFTRDGGVFEALMSSYKTHREKIEAEYGGPSSSSLFSSAKTTDGASSAPAFGTSSSFGTAATFGKGSSGNTTSGFSFTNNTNSASAFGKATASSQDNVTETDATGEETPDVEEQRPTHLSGEDDDSEEVLNETTGARLFSKDPKDAAAAFTLIGRIDLYIRKNKETGKVRVLARNETSRAVVLNSYLSEGQEAHVSENKDKVYVKFLLPDAEKEGALVMYNVRVKNKEVADAFVAAFNKGGAP